MAYSRQQLQEMVRNAALRYGLDARIAVAQINQESGFRTGVTSSAGARGIAQFMPATGAAYGLHTAADFFDPVKSIEAYGRHMRDLLKEFGGDYTRALAAYNAGSGNVRKYGGVPPFKETRNYVSSILKAAGVTAGAVAPAGGTKTPLPTVTTAGGDGSSLPVSVYASGGGSDEDKGGGGLALAALALVAAWLFF